MKVSVAIDDVDSDALAAFCLATGWDETSGVSQEDWLHQQIVQLVMQNAKAGMVRQNSRASLAIYQAALIAAADKATVDMGKVTVSSVTEPSDVKAKLG